MTYLSRVQDWRRWHVLPAHLVAPIWRRLPEKRRWDIVWQLNKSKRFCWSDLVSAALNWFPEDDPCDQNLPLPSKSRVASCNSCEWFGCAEPEPHLSRCYCGKFEFLADHEPNEVPGGIHS